MDDFDDIIKRLDDNFEWPKYSEDGKLVTLRHTDEKGVKWVLMTTSENFNDAMVRAANKIDTNN